MQKIRPTSLLSTKQQEQITLFQNKDARNILKHLQQI